MNTGAMNTGWLAQLAPEHPPLVPAWWPPAPGWWIVAAILIGAIASAAIWWHRPRRRLRRVALRELRRIRSIDADVVQTAQVVQNLLRRYALAAFGADRVARLSGEAWLRFVADHGAESLGGPAGHSLLAASFGAKTSGRQPQDRDAWCAAAEQFMRQAVHRDRQGGSA
ncbi:MAG: DUF4381 domain-containing protein [Steroidobacterales bacterium]